MPLPSRAVRKAFPTSNDRGFVGCPACPPDGWSPNPLLRPDRYFAAHDDAPPLSHAALAVAIATAVGAARIVGQLAATLDVVITVDNPADPGEGICENPAFEDTPSGCDQPPTVQRELGALVAREFSWFPPVSFVLVPVWWLFQTGVLHAASAVVGGEGSFGETLVVAGWGMVPSLLWILGVTAFIVPTVQSLTGPANPDGAVDALRAALSGLQPMVFGLAIVTAVWAGAIRTFGLADARSLHSTTAAGVVGALTVFGLLFELV
ncbi:MAG: Yip1 family protein [Halolamina sp.]|uniref:Yip1 family protein n=1 Tax=Halolamina sp. TaxID=1940283 RepID=UPI002FC33213